MYIENIVIGKSLVEPSHLLAHNDTDWINVEESQTYFTDERFLPKILVDIGVAPSNSEVRRNRKDLFVKLDKPDCLDIKYGRRKFYIIVGK